MSRAKFESRIARAESLRPHGPLAFVCIAVIGLACQPEDESPGTGPSGQETVDVVGDWRFTNAIEAAYGAK